MSWIITILLMITLTNPVQEPVVYYDVPLSEELQDHLMEECREYGLDPEVMLALIETESNFEPYLVSETDDYGLTQINSINFSRMEEEGLDDLLDPKQSITAGCIILGILYERYGDYHLALMAYNYGEAGAMSYWEDGVYSSPYSELVMERSLKY